MALRNPPSWLQNGSHTAENDRLTANQNVWAQTGVRRTNDLVVSQSGTPGMSVSIAAGWGIIVGNFTTNMGAYSFYNDAATTATITAADVTNPRIDRICVTVSDSAYTGSTNTIAFNVVAGTPAGSPVAPATPTNSISLATVLVGAGVTSILNANITDTRVRTEIDEVVLGASTNALVPVRIQLLAGQTGNALQIVNSAGSVLNGFDSSGNLLTGGIDAASLEYEFIMGAY
jgi:hypothetical protein